MKFLLFLIFWCAFSIGYSQKTDNNKQLDSIYPYKRALLYSLIPGGGQIYNSMHSSGRKNAYWKVPLIYVGMGTTAFFLVKNQQMITSIKNEYNVRKTAPPTDPLWLAYDNSALVSLYDQYAQLRDLSILGTGAVYVLQLIDAAVESHFLNFSVSKDLSLAFQPIMSDRFLGAHVQLTFHHPPKR
jgi:hypothetical protein